MGFFLFQTGECLGEGAFGQVYLAEAFTGVTLDSGGNSSSNARYKLKIRRNSHRGSSASLIKDNLKVAVKKLKGDTGFSY